jgi:hypothetical protein
MKLSYFLDHPQIKRAKSFGNGETPSSGIGATLKGMFALGQTQTTAQKAAGTGKAPEQASTGGTGNMKTNISALAKK